MGEHCKSNGHALKKYYAWKYKRFVDKTLRDDWCCSNPRCPYGDEKQDFFFSELHSSSSRETMVTDVDVQAVSRRSATKGNIVSVHHATSSTCSVLWLSTICSKSIFANQNTEVQSRCHASSEGLDAPKTGQQKSNTSQMRSPTKVIRVAGKCTCLNIVATATIFNLTKAGPTAREAHAIHVQQERPSMTSGR